GYRMIVPVEVEEAAEDTASAAAETAPEANEAEKWPAVDRRKPAEKPRTAWKRWMWAAILVLALAATGFGMKWMRAREAAAETARNTALAVNGRVMLAVLPFENLTGD